MHLRPPSPLRQRGPLTLGTLGLTLVLTACGQSVDTGSDTAAAEDSTAVTVETCGTEITVDAPAQRLAGLSPGSTELLLRLGVGDRLVGQGQAATADLPADVVDEVTDVPVISTDVPPAREDLLAVEPDLVISQTTYELTAEQGFATQDQLREAGAAAYVATAGCFDRRAEGTVTDLFADIENLGRLLDVQDTASALVEEYEAELADIEERIAGQQPRTVAQVFVEGANLSVIGAGIERDIIARAGGTNVFDADDPLFSDFFAAQVGPEVVAERNPDAIVFAADSPADEQRVRDYLVRTFPQSTAVQEQRLIAIDGIDTLPGGTGNVRAVRTIAEALYPDAF